MLLNLRAIQDARAFAADTRYQAAAQKLMNSTVLLRGGGQKFFTGSGVILGAGKEVSFDKGKWNVTPTKFTVIVSALHNLSINADKTNQIPPRNGNAVTWDQTYASTFASNVNINYGPAPLLWGEAPARVAKINHVVPIFAGNIGVADKMITIPKAASGDGLEFQLVNLKGATRADGSRVGGSNDGITPVADTETESWSYDVVLLLSKDANLYTYATSGVCNYMGTKTLKELSKELLPSWLGRNPTTVPVLRKNRYKLFQLGYGKTSDSEVPKKTGEGMETRPTKGTRKKNTVISAPVYERLQYKRVSSLAASVTEYYLNTRFKLPNNTDLVLHDQGGMLLNCDGGNNSTFSGDSGGPTAAFPVKGGAEAYLVGVNTGAGVATSEADARKPLGTAGSVWEYDNNVVTSLGLFYEKLYDLRFQNV